MRAKHEDEAEEEENEEDTNKVYAKIFSDIDFSCKIESKLLQSMPYKQSLIRDFSQWFVISGCKSL